jgi:hypothetical protein
VRDDQVAAVHQIDKLETSRQPLPRRYPDVAGVREASVAIEIIGRKRGLQQIEMAIFDLLEHPEHGFRVRPSVAHVHQQGAVGAQGVTTLADRLDHRGIIREGWFDHFELRGAESERPYLLHLIDGIRESRSDLLATR